MSLLSIVQDACRDLSLPVLAAVVGDTTSHAPLMLRVAKEELNSLATRCSWQKLIKENTFSATATAVQVTASAIPTDFDRMLNDSFFNRTQNRKIFGPIDATEWQSIESTLITRVDPAFRFRGGTILITPDPTSNDTLAYEYISKNKALSSGGTEQENWQADTDTSKFPEPIVTLGVGWRYKKAKGFEYSADEYEYERRVAEAILRDGAKPRVYSDAPVRMIRPYPPRTPETIVF